MAEYEIYFKESVWSDLGKVPINDLEKIITKIRKLGDNPCSAGREKFTREALYRTRQGHYRIVHSIQDNLLTVWGVKAGHRKDVCS
jgi:mRNA-degrading endonuclease RelE of RelBE toxin-antitoxin system